MRNQLFAGLAASLILLSIFGSARPAMAQQTNASIARLLQENHVPAAGIGIIRTGASSRSKCSASCAKASLRRMTPCST